MFHYVMTITDKATKKIKKVADLYLHRSIYDLRVREEMVTIYTGQIDLCRYDINFIERQVRQMKKWRNCELHNVDDAEAIRAIRVYCNMHRIPYETSDAGYNLTHFEIYCDDEMAKSFNAIISGKAVYYF